jgi:cysteine desulfurase family protein (TIGR01976 family)
MMPTAETHSFQERRGDFPSLMRSHRGHPLVYFDGPAGTQVPFQVINAMTGYYVTHNANTHGQFMTTRETDRVIEDTRRTVAAFLGARDWRTISFGANMTTLAFSLSKAISRVLKEGDHVLITQLDHEANRGPWLTLADQGIIVEEVKMKQDGTLDYEDLEKKIGKKTKLVALGMASNAVGTVNDFHLVRRLTRKVGAWLILDAVHFAPHFPINVQKIDPDFLLCSAYKFYGPHVGILYTRPGLLKKLQTDRLRTQEPDAPFRIETGTLNHAAIAGVKAAIEYIASCGTARGLRARIVTGMNRIAAHEHGLAESLYNGLKEIPGVQVYGVPVGSGLRAPTLSFTVKGKTAEEVCAALGKKGICAWDGHFYAIRAIEVLGLLKRGGVTRVGMSLYNTHGEVERFLKEVKDFAT